MGCTDREGVNGVAGRKYAAQTAGTACSFERLGPGVIEVAGCLSRDDDRAAMVTGADDEQEVVLDGEPVQQPA